MILLLIASTKVINTHNEAENNSLKYWERTTNLYKTNITNQLNRNNTVEENNYLKKLVNLFIKYRKIIKLLLSRHTITQLSKRIIKNFYWTKKFIKF